MNSENSVISVKINDFIVNTLKINSSKKGTERISMVTEVPLPGPELPIATHSFFYSDDFRTELDRLRGRLEKFVEPIYDGQPNDDEEFSQKITKWAEPFFKDGMSDDDRNYAGLVVKAMVNLVRQVEAAKRERAVEGLPDDEQSRALHIIRVQKEQLLQSTTNWWRLFSSRMGLTLPKFWSEDHVQKGFVINYLI